MGPADWVGVGALAVSLVTCYVTLSPVRRALKLCELERLELRRRLELVTAAIIGTLPREQRIDLLVALDERITPANGQH